MLSCDVVRLDLLLTLSLLSLSLLPVVLFPRSLLLVHHPQATNT